MLRKALEVGRYSLFDEEQVLKERADRRSRLKWVSDRDKTPEQGSVGNESIPD